MKMDIWRTCLLAFSLITTLKLFCNGQILSAFSTAMDLYYNGQMLADLFSDSRSDTYDKVGVDIENFKIDVDHKFDEIFKRIDKLPGVQDLEKKREELQRHSAKIFHGYADVTKFQKQINRGTIIRHEETIKRLGYLNAQLISHWEDICDILLSSNSSSFLLPNFYDELQEFENVCVTHMSHLQLLNTLLLHFEMSAVQYFYARHIIFNYYDFYYEGHEAKHDDRREGLNDDFKKQFRSVVNFLKAKMTNPSQKFWRCDPAQFDDSSYRELQTYSTYLAQEDQLPQTFKSCGFHCNLKKKASSDGSELPEANACIKEKCNDPSVECTSSHSCKTRGCKNKLIDCRPLPITYGYKVCLSDEPMNAKRYSSVAQNDETFVCSNDQFPLRSTKSFDYAQAFFSKYVLYRYSWSYKCICPEKEYYVSYIASYADKGYVVIGAQLKLLNDNVLTINIKQGKPLPGGYIDSNSTSWPRSSKKYEKNALSFNTKISWEDCNEIDLTDIEVKKGHVIVGLGFSDCENGRFRLKVYTKAFNYLSGQVSGVGFKVEKPIGGTEEYDMVDRDASTKAQDKNTPDSGDNDYVRFSFTSLIKDGGQSIIPFIDLQEVVPQPYTALSGASFIIRGQEGYGGFLALQLRTYDIVPHIAKFEQPVQAKIDKTLASL